MQCSLTNSPAIYIELKNYGFQPQTRQFTVPAWNFQSHWNAFYYETCISLLKIHRFAMIFVSCFSIRCKVESTCRSHPHNSTTMSHSSLCLFHTLFFKNRPYLSQQRLCHLTFLLCFMYTNTYHSLCTCVDFTYNAVDFLKEHTCTPYMCYIYSSIFSIRLLSISRLFIPAC